MTASTVMARRKEDPQHYVDEKTETQHSGRSISLDLPFQFESFEMPAPTRHQVNDVCFSSSHPCLLFVTLCFCFFVSLFRFFLSLSVSLSYTCRGNRQSKHAHGDQWRRFKAARCRYQTESRPVFYANRQRKSSQSNEGPNHTAMVDH